MRRLTSAIIASVLLVPLGSTAPAAAAAARHIDYTVWHGHGDFAMGSHPGLRITASRLALRDGVDTAAWTSPWAATGFALTRLVASWTAITRGDSHITVEVRGRSGETVSSWDTLGEWAQDDTYFHRTTQSGQDDDLGSVNVDTWVVPGGVTAYQLRITLTRADDGKGPAVSEVGAMASALPAVDTVTTSRPGVARGIVLDVPRYSQMIHRGEYPQYGGGGEAWCSPTSTSMVLGYYGALPKAKDYAWVDDAYADPWVDHAARMTYDYEYEGTGNWPFNTAYAANLAGHAFVTRLPSLRPAERFIKAGIPLVASIAFGPGELDGAPISSTNGHLVVIVGFTKSGDVVVNDPAAATNAGVRRTYDRGQFENAWVPKSGGTVYVIRDDAHPLPPNPRWDRAR